MALSDQREFAAQLTIELAREEGNLFVSPFSAWCLLAMLHAGARGRTRETLERVLGIDPAGDPGDVFDEVRTLTSDDPAPRQFRALDLEGPPESFPDSFLMQKRRFDLVVANAAWLQQGYELDLDYVALIHDRFDARVDELDLTSQPEAACKTINDWSNRSTRGRISQVISPTEIGPLSRLILSNATYFKDDWASEFEPEETRSEPFHRPEGDEVEVPMMHQTARFGYYEDSRLQAVRLPYAHGRMSMTIVLPTDIREFEERFKSKKLDRLVGSLESSTLVYLALPKCRFRNNLQLVQPLENIGLGALFDESADLSGISPEPGLGVDEVRQASCVQVDEQGTEAAAVTIATVIGAALHEVAPEPKQMIVDRPYWFFIRHDPSGCLVFAGRVEDPS